MGKKSKMKDGAKRLNLGILAVFVGILFLASISVSLHEKSEPVSITVMPSVPREGLPILITFNLNNPSQVEDMMSYELYANGALLTEGSALLHPSSTKKYTYVYPDSPKLGERITFMVKTRSEQGAYDKVLSLPAYPPQVWSSFVSFASFSTSLMGSSFSSSMSTSIASTQYYSNHFIDNNKSMVGLIFSIVLILLLIYLELTEALENKSFRIMGLRIRFGRLSVILFIVFAGMVFTKVVMIIE